MPLEQATHLLELHLRATEGKVIALHHESHLGRRVVESRQRSTTPLEPHCGQLLRVVLFPRDGCLPHAILPTPNPRKTAVGVELGRQLDEHPLLVIHHPVQVRLAHIDEYQLLLVLLVPRFSKAPPSDSHEE